MDNCLFCKIVSGEIPCHKIYEDDYVLAFLDIACDAVGHTVVVAKKHFDNILSVDNDYLQNMLESTRKIARNYVEKHGYDGFQIVNNYGVCAGQSHFHFHIVPRRKDDGVPEWSVGPKMEMDLAEIAKTHKIN